MTQYFALAFKKHSLHVCIIERIRLDDIYVLFLWDLFLLVAGLIASIYFDYLQPFYLFFWSMFE